MTLKINASFSNAVNTLLFNLRTSSWEQCSMFIQDNSKSSITQMNSPEANFKFKEESNSVAI